MYMAQVTGYAVRQFGFFDEAGWLKLPVPNFQKDSISLQI